LTDLYLALSSWFGGGLDSSAQYSSLPLGKFGLVVWTLQRNILRSYMESFGGLETCLGIWDLSSSAFNQ
jgi:hypothetical protein